MSCLSSAGGLSLLATIRLAALVLGVALATAGCQDDGTGERLLPVGVPVGEAEAPVSTISSVALLPDGVACVADSYFFQVWCLHRDRPAQVWGRQGEGPGEFARIQHVMRGPEGSVAVVDGSLNRITAFLPSGQRVSETRVPSLFTPDRYRGDVLHGHYMQIAIAGMSIRQVEIASGSGELLWERAFPRNLAYPECDDPSADLEARGSAFGTATPSGGMVFAACDGRLVLFPDRDDDSTAPIPRPAYAGELPNQRDVDEFVDARRGSVRGEASSADVEAFRRQPKEWFYTIPDFDDAGRMWLLTSRDRDEFSYLELFVGDEYAGTVRVADRVVGFDVLGSALAVLVKRRARPDDPDGIDDRAVVWYDISGLPAGRLD